MLPGFQLLIISPVMYNLKVEIYGQTTLFHLQQLHFDMFTKKYIYNILKNEFRKDTQNTAAIWWIFKSGGPPAVAWMRHFVCCPPIIISKEVNALFTTTYTAQELMLPIGIIILPKVLTECGREEMWMSEIVISLTDKKVVGTFGHGHLCLKSSF